MRMKGLTLFFSCILLIFGGAGCASDDQHLTVSSTDYVNLEYLKEGSLSDFKSLGASENEAYGGFQCYVSKTNWYADQPQRLVVNNDRANPLCSCFGANGYFVGANYTEFASGITFFTYTGVENAKGSPMPMGRCIALLENEDPDVCYAITSWNHFDEGQEANAIALWRLHFPTQQNDFQYSAEKICNIAKEDSAIAAVMTSTGKIMVATRDALYSVTTAGEALKLEIPDQWQDLLVNSMVAIEDRLYFGTKYGVLSYQPQDKCFSWYPVDYGKITFTNAD